MPYTFTLDLEAIGANLNREQEIFASRPVREHGSDVGKKFERKFVKFRISYLLEDGLNGTRGG